MRLTGKKWLPDGTRILVIRCDCRAIIEYKGEGGGLISCTRCGAKKYITEIINGNEQRRQK